MATAFTPRGASNMKDSSNAASFRPACCQHFASSKLAPSLEVIIFTCPGAYAQSTFKPKATRREFKRPVHVTPFAQTPNRTAFKGVASCASAQRKCRSHRCPHHGCRSSTWARMQMCMLTLVGNLHEAIDESWSANSQSHPTRLAGPRKLTTLPSCLQSMCWWRWRHRRPHIAGRAPWLARAPKATRPILSSGSATSANQQ